MSKKHSDLVKSVADLQASLNAAAAILECEESDEMGMAAALCIGRAAQDMENVRQRLEAYSEYRAGLKTIPDVIE